MLIERNQVCGIVKPFLTYFLFEIGIHNAFIFESWFTEHGAYSHLVFDFLGFLDHEELTEKLEENNLKVVVLIQISKLHYYAQMLEFKPLANNKPSDFLQKNVFELKNFFRYSALAPFKRYW